MRTTSILSKLMIGMASVALSTSVFAAELTKTVTEPVGDTLQMTKGVWDASWEMNGPHDPEYMVTDKDSQMVKYLDGLDKGNKVSDQGGMLKGKDCLMGDTITNLHTKRSGVITGVKDSGTMDVMAPSGKTVRYEYIIYKVKPMK